jgi:hypothetical protein
MGAELKRGKAPATYDKRDLKFRDFVVPERLPTPPSRFGFGAVLSDWGMLGNGPDDSVQQGFLGAGDCVFAGADHETMLWSAAARHPVTFSGANAIADYSALTGYVIGDDATDNGTNVRDALGYRRSTGVVDAAGARHVIGAYVSLEPGNWEELIQAAYVLLVVGIGIQFPDSAMDQFDRGEIWSVVPGARIEGGHYVSVTGRRAADDIGLISWGRRQGMTRSFYTTYCDEAWGIISVDELDNGKNVRGLDYAALEAALKQLPAGQPAHP